MNAPPEVTRKYLRKRAVAARYDDCSLKSIDRWAAAGILPRAAFSINGVDYWAEDELDAHDRARAVATGAGKVVRRFKGKMIAPPAEATTP